MDTKIQELTDKIFKDGVEKGNKEASRIIAEAEASTKTLIEKAEATAKDIVMAAEKQASELKKNTESELKLFASQSVEALKSEVVNLITDNIVSSNIKAAVADPSFMQKVILTLIEGWSDKEMPVIQTSDAESLRQYFLSNAKDLLDKGLKIEQVNGKKTSFSVQPSDGSYKITFGEDEFIEYFKEFLRPQLVKTLF